MEKKTVNGYFAQLAHAKSLLPTVAELRAQAKREKRDVVARALLADDTIATVKAGPRGGLRILSRI
jgi:hypothetical protein